VFNNYFNSSEFILRKAPQSTNLYFSPVQNDSLFFLGYLSSGEPEDDNNTKKSSLLLVESGIDLINNGDQKFSSRAGNPIEA
jgi:hypothetical protein